MSSSAGEGHDDADGIRLTPARLVLSLAAIVLVSLCLRIPTTSIGPLLPRIEADTGHGETFLSLLTALPLALSLVAAPLTPRLAALLGVNRTLTVALVGICIGTLIRSVPGDVPLLVGTAVLGIAIAVGTVLAPAAIAAVPRSRRGLFTAMYTMALSLGPALALGATIPIMTTTGLDWRGTLIVWTACGVVALVLWQVHARNLRRVDSVAAPSAADAASDPAVVMGAQATPAAHPVVGPSVLRDPRAWALAVYLGITSLTFYTTSTWLPTVLVAEGVDAAASGGMAALVNVVAIPFAFLAPIGMRRGLTRALVPLAPAVALIGACLLLVPDAAAALPAAVLLGIGQGLCLGVSYDRVVQYAPTPVLTAAVSALTSTVGIALAAVGPFLFGLGLEAGDSRLLPLLGLAAVIAIQVALGAWPDRGRHP